MFCSGLDLQLPKAAARMKKALQDPQEAWEENLHSYFHCPVWALGASVSQQQPRAPVRTWPAQVHTVLAGPHLYTDFMFRKPDCV